MSEDLEQLIDAYLDGRMEPAQKEGFEARMNSDPALKERVTSATRSVELVQQALGWVTPDDSFDKNINTKIVSLTQSQDNLRVPSHSSDGNLTSRDPDSKLLHDPTAAREQTRLGILAMGAGVLFLLAAAAIAYSIVEGVKH